MKTAKLLAFHGDSKVKAHYLKRVRAHRKADEIASGHYWEERSGRMTGCAVGCTLHSGSHSSYETELGIPTVLARLEDRLFEGLWTRDNEFAKVWPENFLKAVKPGADLSLVWPKFALWLLGDAAAGVIRFAKNEGARAAILGVTALYQRWAAGDKPATNEWESARSVAAAYDAAAAAAAYADAAAAAAYADAAADAAARRKHYLLMANKLLELMKEAK